MYCTARTLIITCRHTVREQLDGKGSYCRICVVSRKIIGELCSFNSVDIVGFSTLARILYGFIQKVARDCNLAVDEFIARC